MAMFNSFLYVYQVGYPNSIHLASITVPGISFHTPHLPDLVNVYSLLLKMAI